MAARRRTTARAAVLPARRGVPELRRIGPSGRSVLLGVALLALAIGGYVAARETSVFAVREVQIAGGTPALQAQVRTALGDEVGRSLLRVDGAALDARLSRIPALRSFGFDRSFPHTLRVVVQPERPLLVVRQADRAYLVSASGKVVRALARPRLSSLPRLWLPRDVHIVVGSRLPGATADAAIALAPLEGAALPGGIRTVKAGEHVLSLELGGGLEVRLGDTGDLRLKLAVARRILRATGAATAGGGYLDVSVPERAVLAVNPQVAG